MLITWATRATRSRTCSTQVVVEDPAVSEALRASGRGDRYGRASGRGTSGQATVEFALLLPLVVFAALALHPGRTARARLPRGPARGARSRPRGERRSRSRGCGAGGAPHPARAHRCTSGPGRASVSRSRSRSPITRSPTCRSSARCSPTRRCTRGRSCGSRNEAGARRDDDRVIGVVARRVRARWSAPPGSGPRSSPGPGPTPRPTRPRWPRPTCSPSAAAPSAAEAAAGETAAANGARLVSVLVRGPLPDRRRRGRGRALGASAPVDGPGRGPDDPIS